MRWRFAAVGLVATAIDVGVLLALGAGLGWPVPLADATAIALAACWSFLANRAVTFAGRRWVRWVAQPRRFVVVALVGGAVDVAVLSAVVALVGPVGWLGLALAKIPALGVAAAVRLVGYRQVLFRSVRRDQAVRVERPPAGGAVRLSVVIPAYRAEASVGEVVQAVRTELASVADAGGLEIVVADDGSDDATAEAARSAGADVVVRLPENRGKGAAVRAGMAATHGRTVAFLDADLSYRPAQLLAFVDAVEEGWDLAVGSRRHVDARTLVRTGRLRELTGRAFNLLTHLALLGLYRDTQCGIKAFRSDVAHLLFGRSRVDRFAFDVELFHLAERYRLSLVEIPVAVTNSERSTVRVARDAARMVRDVFRIRRWSAAGVYDPAPGPGDLLDRPAGRPQ